MHTAGLHAIAAFFCTVEAVFIKSTTRKLAPVIDINKSSIARVIASSKICALKIANGEEDHSRAPCADGQSSRGEKMDSGE